MGALARPAKLRYAAVVSVWACCAIASPGCSAPVPGTTRPGGNPVIESAGHTPTLPLTTLGPTLVTLGVAPRTAKLDAVPRSWAAAGALAMRSKATAVGRRASDMRVMFFFCLRSGCAKPQLSGLAPAGSVRLRTLQRLACARAQMPGTPARYRGDSGRTDEDRDMGANADYIARMKAQLK